MNTFVLCMRTYRLAADLEDNLRPPVRPLPLLAPQPLTSALASAMRNPLRAIFSLGSSASGIKGGSILGSDDMYSEYQLEAFCKALLLVETEREKSLRNLQVPTSNGYMLCPLLCDRSCIPLVEATAHGRAYSGEYVRPGHAAADVERGAEGMLCLPASCRSSFEGCAHAPVCVL
jgi:hypothetical protein